MKPGWQKKMLAEVCQIRPPKSEARERITPDSLVSFVPMEDLGIDKKFLNAMQVRPLASIAGSYTYFAEGDVLLAKITPCFENGKLGIAAGLTNGIGFGSSEFIVFRPSALLDKEYLYYYLLRPDFRSEGALRMGGSVGQQRVTKDFIESYLIPIPPLPEQQRIVRILDEVFEGVATATANVEKNLRNARALFESYLQSVFERKGAEWKQEKMEEVCSVLTCGVASTPTYVDESVGIPFLSAQNVKNGEVILDKYRFISREFHEKLTKKNKPKKGDILYSRVGAKYGEAGVVEHDFEFSVYVSLTLIRPKPEKLNNYFLKYYLNSPLVKLLANNTSASF